MKETVFEHFAGNPTCTITAGERWSINRIRKLAEKYLDQVEIAYVNTDGSILAYVPVSWMKIQPKRNITMSDERREALREHLKKARAVRFGDNESVADVDSDDYDDDDDDDDDEDKVNLDEAGDDDCLDNNNNYGS